MNINSALKIFNIQSIKNESLNSLKERYIKLVKKNHPDKGGDTHMCAQINVAFNYLNKILVENNNQKKFLIKDINEFGPDFVIDIEPISFRKVL